MSKPGVMLYFDIIPALRIMPEASRGRLLMAILNYAYDGTEPEDLDDWAYSIWALMQPKIDRDDLSYNQKVENAKRSTRKREERRKLLNRVIAESENLDAKQRKLLQSLEERDDPEEEAQ